MSTESLARADGSSEFRASGLREFLHVLFKHKGKVVSVFFAFALAAILLSFMVPPSYEAQSSLLVKLGREYYNIPEFGNMQPFMSLKQEEVINSEIQILTSRELIEKVISTMTVQALYPGLAQNPPAGMTTLEAAILTFEKELAVEGVRKSNVIRVSFRHNEPRVAANAVNLLVELFRDKHLQVFNTSQFSFLDKQFETYGNKLRDSEERLEQFKKTHGVYSFDEQRSLLIRQRTELDGSLMSTRHRIDEMRERLASLNARKKADARSDAVPIHADTERDKIVVDAKAKLLSLRLKEQELLKIYNDGSTMVADIREDIRLVEKFLKDQEEDIRKRVRTGNVVYQEMESDLIRTEADLKSQMAKSAALEKQLSELDRDIATLSLREKEFHDLNREMAMNEKTFQAYSEKLEDARISDDMNRHKLANISVINTAAPPAEPVSPKKKLNVAVGILLGALSGLALAFFSEYSSQFLSRPEDVERRLGLPVLATVSYKE